MTLKIYFDAASFLPDLQIREAKHQWLCPAQRVPSGPPHQRDSCSKYAPFLPQQWPLPGIISGESNLGPWKITHDRSQEISVFCLFRFWQAIYFKPKSECKSYNWLHPPYFFGRWNSSCASSYVHSFQPHWDLNEYKWPFTSTRLQFCEGRCPGFLLTMTVTSTLCVLKHVCFMKENKERTTTLVIVRERAELENLWHLSCVIPTDSFFLPWVMEIPM